MGPRALEVADIFRTHGPAFRATQRAHLSLGQLKVIQEIITMIVFAGFAVLYMRQPLKMDYLWAGFCLIGAAYFIFRGGAPHA